MRSYFEFINSVNTALSHECWWILLLFLLPAWREQEWVGRAKAPLLPWTLALDSGSHSLFLVLGTPDPPSWTYTGTSLFPNIADSQAFFTMIIYGNLFDVFAPLPQLLQTHPFPYPTNFVSKTKLRNNYKIPHHPWWDMKCILICG